MNGSRDNGDDEANDFFHAMTMLRGLLIGDIAKMINKMKQTSRNAPRYSLSTIVLIACVTKKDRLKAVQVFLKFSGMASNKNKKVFILDF